MPGASTSKAEVTNLSRHGIRLLVGERELFMPFAELPRNRGQLTKLRPYLVTCPFFPQGSRVVTSSGSRDHAAT